MTLEFKSSSSYSLGVEIELQILDPDTLDLNPKSEVLIQTCQQRNLERVKAEIHQSMIEIDTEISKDVKECRSFLTTRLERLNEIAKELNVEIAISGTHPFQKWENRLIYEKSDRYHKLFAKYQWLARRMNVYGMHVHVGMKNETSPSRV